MRDGSFAARLGRAIIVRALAGWEEGRLRVSWPDGTSTVHGEEAEPSADIAIRDPAFFSKVALRGEIGFGESFVDGDWSTNDLPELLRAVTRNMAALQLDGPVSLIRRFTGWLRHRARSNTRAGSRRNIHAHYDLSNDMFALFLDDTMTYSSAVFDDRTQELADAQRNKYARLAHSAGIQEGDHVLEIGCGWGGFAIWAAREIGCHVTAVTISEEQLALTEKRVREAGLEHLVRPVLSDYRDLQGQYDRIVSIEMFEAVGASHWTSFFLACERLLKPNGTLAMQMITLPDHRVAEYRRSRDWIQEYIFPGGELAAVGHVCQAAARSSELGIHGLVDIGVHYAETLVRWRDRFFAEEGRVRGLGFDTRFVRMWDYYLSSCQAMFAERHLSVVQTVFSRPGNRTLPGVPPKLRVAAA